jgi:acetolactate synthase-1/2/3 large subunit
MGWSYPASLGAKLAAPDVPVVALVGDGDFLMTFQEIATAVQYGIPSIAVVFNNLGWQAIRDLQVIAYGEEAVYATMFEQEDRLVTPNIAEAARAFGAHGVRISQPEDVAPALKEAMELQRPSVIEIMIDAQLGTSGGIAPGWWDVPVPEYLEKRRRAYDQDRKEERV